MGEEFENGEGLGSVRSKLNKNAREITALAETRPTLKTGLAVIGVAPDVSVNNVDVTTAGIYPLYGGLTVGTTDLDGKTVQFRKVNGVWTKYVSPISFVTKFAAQNKGVFESLELALSAVPLVKDGTLYRKLGDTVGIKENGIIVDYWWDKSISDSGLVTKNAGLAKSSDIGITGSEILDSHIQDNVTILTITGSKTIIINRIIGSENVTNTKVWATVAGNIIIGAYTVSNGLAVRLRSVIKTLVVGENDVSEILLKEGEYFGIAYNTTSLPGRVGCLVTPAPYSWFNISTNVSTSTATGTATNVNRWGISIKTVPKSAINPRLEKAEKYVFGDGNILDNVSSEMIDQGKWVQNIGALPVTFVDGVMSLNFTTGNQNVQINDILEVSKKYTIQVKARVLSGNIKAITFGSFSGTSSDTQKTQILTNTFAEYSFELIGKTGGFTYFSIGALAANNLGGIVEIEYVKIIDNSLTINGRVDERLKTATIPDANTPNSFFTDAVWASLSKYDKPLTKICVLGDSLMGNALGGVYIPEGAGYAPMRLTYNTIARRLYDLLSWNKPNHVRASQLEWIRSGAWTGINNTAIFEPTYTNETYLETVTTGAYIEIVVPAGKENFAAICQKFTGFGKLNVTLNGGSIAAYGPAQIDLAGGGNTGNPYYTIQYLGLPAGANTIRFTKEADTKTVRIWGGLYWSGNTLIVQNIAHGGHTMGELINEHLSQELVENNFDAVLFEITLMNELSINPVTSEAESLSNFESIIKEYIGNKPLLTMSCLPFGLNPDSSINFYTTYPGMKERALAIRKLAYSLKVPHVDIFTAFERKILSRGGTLVGGQGGLYYTIDGQHENNEGLREWFNMLKPIIRNNPLLND